MNLDRLRIRDQDLTRPIEEAFRRVSGFVPCHRGCSSCCVAFFPITVLDLWRLSEGLARLDADMRADAHERALDVVARARAFLPYWGHPWNLADLGWQDFERLGDTVPATCPLLDPSGACLLYENRPRICRLQGVAWVDPSGAADLPDFCAEIHGDARYATLPPQPLDLLGQWELEAELRVEVVHHVPHGLRPSYKTFVAGAVCVILR